jgi:hypothetical protein
MSDVNEQENRTLYTPNYAGCQFSPPVAGAARTAGRLLVARDSTPRPSVPLRTARLEVVARQFGPLATACEVVGYARSPRATIRRGTHVGRCSVVHLQRD